MRLVFAVALLAALWSAFCVEERWRGRRKWEQYRGAAIARGVPLSVEDILPPNIPDAENFAAIPMIQELFSAQEAHQTLPVWFAALKLDSPDSRRPAFHGFEPPQLDAWRDHFVREGVLAAAGPDAAADVLAAIDKVEPELGQLREAGRRPRCKFPVHWERGFAAGVPHLTPLMSAVNVYQLRMSAHLARGDSAAAYADFREGLRIYTALRGELALISGLVRVAMVEKLAGRVRDGIAGGKWAAAELSNLQADFAQLRIADDWKFALNSERAVMNTVSTELHGRSDRSLAQLLDDVATGGGRHPSSPFAISLYPRGWLWLSQRKINEYFDRSVARVDAVTAGQPFALPSNVSADVEELARKGPLAKLPYILYVMLTPALGKVENTYLHALTTVAEGEIACALERHRLVKSTFPERLDSLVPEFIQSLPQDPVAQAPMHYRQTSSGGFDLWSVALNRVDDSAAEKPGTGPKDQPDWVWRR
jgi:hypothetical protein